MRPIQALSSSPSQATPQAPAGRLAQFSESLQELVTKVSPAVVQIEVTGFRPFCAYEVLGETGRISLIL
jgi:S1-C subfamily serine protease